MNRTEIDGLFVPELLLKKKLNRRLSVETNQLNSNWEKVKDSLDKIQAFIESRMELDKREMLKYQEKLKGSIGSFQISETVSTVTTPGKRAMRISVEQEEAMKQTWFNKLEKSRPPATLSIDRIFGADCNHKLREKASFSKTGKYVTVRPSEEERRLKREITNVGGFKNFS